MTTDFYTKQAMDRQTTSDSGARRVGVEAFGDIPAGLLLTVLTILKDRIALRALATRLISTSGGLQGGGDLSADRTLSIADTAVTPNTYTLATVTVDQKGRITSASNGSAGGVADASTTVKGATKMSVAPVSPTEPIAAGTNDGRIPTQGENDALVGTSGTPSSSNKYVTNDDARLTRYKTITVSSPGVLAVKTGAGRTRVNLPPGVTTCTIWRITAQLNTVSSSGSVTVDVNRAVAASYGTLTTLYTTQGNRPSIAASGRDVVATLPDVTTLNDGDHITVDQDAVGTGSSDLVVQIEVSY